MARSKKRIGEILLEQGSVSARCGKTQRRFASTLGQLRQLSGGDCSLRSKMQFA